MYFFSSKCLCVSAQPCLTRNGLHMSQGPLLIGNALNLGNAPRFVGQKVWLVEKSLISVGKSLPAQQPKHASGAPEPPDWSGSRNPPHSWSFPVNTKLKLMQSLMRFKTPCCKQKVDALWEPDFKKNTLRGTLQVNFRSKKNVVEDTIDVPTLSCALIFMRFRPKSSCNCNAKRAWGAKKVFSEKNGPVKIRRKKKQSKSSVTHAAHLKLPNKI